MNRCLLFILSAMFAVPAYGQAATSTVLLNRKIKVNGVDRTYRAYLPNNYASLSKAAQVIMGFHPAKSSGSGFARISKLHVQPGAEKFIIAYPDGIEKKNSGRAWNAGTEEARLCCTSGEDVLFFDEILTDLSQLTKNKLKPGVAITGYSSGAMMVYRLLCDRSDEIAMAIPFAAYLPDNFISDKNLCQWSHTVPTMHVHGLQDAQMKPEGQANAYYPGSSFKTSAIKDHIKVVAKRNGGNLGLQANDLGYGIIWTIYNASTSYVSIEGLGHTWPGASAVADYGPAREEINLSNILMTSFFSTL